MLIQLNYVMHLEANYSYEQFINLMKNDDLLFIWNEVATGDDVTIIDQAGHRLETCGSDLIDHIKKPLDRAFS